MTDAERLAARLVDERDLRIAALEREVLALNERIDGEVRALRETICDVARRRGGER